MLLLLHVFVGHFFLLMHGPSKLLNNLEDTVLHLWAESHVLTQGFMCEPSTCEILYLQAHVCNFMLPKAQSTNNHLAKSGYWAHQPDTPTCITSIPGSLGEGPGLWPKTSCQPGEFGHGIQKGFINRGSTFGCSLYHTAIFIPMHLLVQSLFSSHSLSCHYVIQIAGILNHWKSDAFIDWLCWCCGIQIADPVALA